MAELIGQMLGPYRIIEQVGAGGMATVYKAYQASVDRYVAVKVLPRQFAEDPSFLGRFEQEARTIAKLEHPHILPVHDYGEQGGTTYLVMRFVGAGTLKALVSSRGPLDPNQTLRIMEQVGGALGYAHGQGVIHRDVKPSNVLMDARGDCFLTDFGIARLVEATSEFTASGRIVGTPAYMSPEQGMGEKVDARSDIYALGVVLYEMVTGKVPFEAETPLAVLMKHATAPLPLPRQVKPDLPESVERVILKALSKSPDDRFQRVEDMISALRQAILPSATSATGVSPPASSEETTDVAEQVPPTQVVTPSAPGYPAPMAPGTRAGRSLLPLIAAGVVGLFALVVVAILLSRSLASAPQAESPPAPTGLQATSPLAGAKVTPSPGDATPPQAESARTQTGVPAQEPGWTVYVSGDDTRKLVVQGDTIWAGGTGGLVRWNRSDGSYQQVTVADGLASNQINDMLIDPSGILWVGTAAGVSRFDPQADRWTTFDTADGLDADHVVSLYYDEEADRLVVGTAGGDRGINIYDGAQWRSADFPPIPLESPEPRVMLNAEGTFLVGLASGGLAYYNGEEWQVVPVNPEEPEIGINDLYLTGQGELLAAAWQGVFRLDVESETWEAIPQLAEFSTNAILEDSQGVLWFAGDGGVFRFDPNLGDWEFFESESEELPAWRVTDVVEDAHGALWFGLAGSGLSRLEDGDWQVWAVGEGPAGNEVIEMVEDANGDIWVAPDGGHGLSRYRPATGSWQAFSAADGALDWPGGLAVDQAGRVWAGDWAGARFFDGERWHTFENASLGESTVLSIAQDESGAMWFGTEERIIRLDPDDGSTRAFTAQDGLPEGEVHQLHPAPNGLVLANVDNKLFVFDGQHWDRQLPDQDEIYHIVTAPSGAVWVAGGDKLFVYEGQAWESIPVPEVWAESLAFDPEGKAWVGSWDGLALFDPAGGTWKYLEPGDGRLPPDVRTVLVGGDGTLWVGTGGGVGQYVPPR